jgi:hypothetical protein
VIGVNIMTGFSLGNNDVVSIDRKKSPLGFSTFKVIELTENLANRMGQEFDNETLAAWILEGIPCEAMETTGGGWQKGKVRISLEFIPDDISENQSQKASLIPSLKRNPLLDGLQAELLNNE